MVHFVGAGSGAVDLITVRGAKLLGECDVVIYAGSLVNPALLAYCRKDCRIYNSAEMTLEQVIDAIRKAEAAGETTVRLHTGDSSIFGAVREQFDELDKLGITRAPGRTPVPEKQSIAALAAQQATMVHFLRTSLTEKLQRELLAGGYPESTPAAVVYKATWPEEKIFRCTVGTLHKTVTENGLTKTSLIIVGECMGDKYLRSLLYHPGFTTEFREATE